VLSRLLPLLGRHSIFLSIAITGHCANWRTACFLTPIPRPNPASGDKPHEHLLDQIIAFRKSGLYVPH